MAIFLALVIPVYFYFHRKAKKRAIEQQRMALEMHALAALESPRTLNEEDLLAFPITKYKSELELLHVRVIGNVDDDYEIPIAKSAIADADIATLPLVISEQAPIIINADSSDNLTNQESHSTCVICLDAFEEDCLVRILPCHHTFHLLCIDAWLTQKSATCPCCRVDYKTVH